MFVAMGQSGARRARKRGAHLLTTAAKNHDHKLTLRSIFPHVCGENGLHLVEVVGRKELPPKQPRVSDGDVHIRSEEVGRKIVKGWLLCDTVYEAHAAAREE